MMKFIETYWQTSLYGVLVFCVGFMMKKVKKQVCKQKALEEGVLALLHDRLFQACSFYIAKGKIPIEALENIDCLYKSYDGLDGNSTGTEIYERAKNLELEERGNENEN